MKYRIYLLLTFFFPAMAALAQYPRDYFRSPLDIPLQLSGTFAELRTNHFHTGLDFRTQQAEGKNVYATADGYVSRIRISPVGYGKAIYITHPNGFTTVYGHLQRFNWRIGQWVKNEHYRLEQFDVDLFPKANTLPVKKGEIIAYSGNSGSSGGPHLHYEIRETKSEKPVDPVLFGINVRDNVKPVITALRVYPESPTATVNGSARAVNVALAGSGSYYKLSGTSTLLAGGPVSFGIRVHDLQTGSSNVNGINQVEVWVDDAKAFHWSGEKLDFSEGRFVNSFIDYSLLKSAKTRYIRTKVDPNNSLTTYKAKSGDGVINVAEGKTANIRIIAGDSWGNRSEIRFQMKGVAGSSSPAAKLNCTQWFSHKSGNEFKADGFYLNVPGKMLYDDVCFDYASRPATANTLSPVHEVGSDRIPLHGYVSMGIKPAANCVVPADKLLIVQLNEVGKPSAVGGKLEGGFLTARIREFGRYAIMADTVKPVITPLNIADKKNIGAQSTIRMRITDNLSGLNVYRGKMNGKWILFDYDAKNNLLVYAKDDRTVKGTNELELYVEDGSGNSSTYKATLIN